MSDFFVMPQYASLRGKLVLKTVIYILTNKACTLYAQKEIANSKPQTIVTTQPVQRVHKQIFATDYADVTD